MDSPALCMLVMGLLSIPASNADSERGFSILPKIHTDQRSSLKQSTIIDLMSVKFNSHNCCFDSELSEDLLKSCKKATTLATPNNLCHPLLLFIFHSANHLASL